MGGSSFFHEDVWRPLARFGVTHHFFELNKETLINTWWALALLLLLALYCRYALQNPTSVAGRLVLSGLRSLMSLVTQSMGNFSARYYYFVGSLFLFIITCNLLIVLPGLEEPTKDINTTFGLALISLFYAQKEGFYAHGFLGYLQEYFKMPFTLFPDGKVSLKTAPLALLKGVLNLVIGLLTFPLELLGKAASLLSLSLRLFGNIFGGSIITAVLRHAASGSWLVQTLVTGLGISLIVTLFFGIFEAFIQAFVFTILSTTYIAMAIQKDESHDDGTADQKELVS